MSRIALVVAVSLLTLPSIAAAEHIDVWSEPNPGVRYLHRTTDRPCSIHALVVDLSHSGVRVETTEYDDRWTSVSEHARTHRLAAAVNGGFWSSMARAQGITAGGGVRWPVGSDDDEYGFFAVTRDGRAWISRPEDVYDGVPAHRLSEAVSGRPLLVEGGGPASSSLDAFEMAGRRHPRTAVGVSRDGRTVFLVVVDGRQSNSRGATLYEVADLMVELGAHTALNLDGGGSSTMFVSRLGGVVSAPSGGRWEAELGLGVTEEEGEGRAKIRTARDGLQETYVRGVEREVMNHIGIVAPAPAFADSAADTFSDLPPIDTIGDPRPPPVQLGRLREILYPVGYAALALALPTLLLILWYRRRRRRTRTGDAVPAPGTLTEVV